MRLMLLLTIALSICSCASVERPDADLCGINFAADKPPHLHCYNIKNDYNDDGSLKAGARAHDKLIGAPQSLNAGDYISKEDIPKVKVWLQDMRDFYKEHCE